MVDFNRLTESLAEARVHATPVPADVLPFPGDWAEALAPARDEDWFRELASWYVNEILQEGADVLPPEGLVFEALRLTPLAAVRVVLLGQDPYPHAAACGLAFSVPPGVVLPASARRVREELTADGFEPGWPGLDLRPWARAGCLLLNHTLTVRRGAPGSHYHKGWEQLTTRILQAVQERDAVRWRRYHAEWNGSHPLFGTSCQPPPPAPVVCVALGQWARSALDGTGGVVCFPSSQLVTAPHPAAREGQFLGSRPFSRANLRLEELGGAPFPWRLPHPRETLFEALRAAWTLPPREGRAALFAAISGAEEAQLGAEEVDSARDAHAALDRAVRFLVLAGRRLRPGNVSEGGWS